MNKKQLANQLNSQKGLTAADVVIALLMIITAVSVISMVYVNLVINSREVDRKTGATRIATNIIENMSQSYYNQLTENLTGDGVTKSGETTYIIEKDKIFNTTIPKGYQVKIQLENSYGDQAVQYDLVKKATVTVIYKVNGEDKEVSFSKVFEREVVRECNSPNFTEEYIQEICSEEFEMYSSTAGSGAGVKIICPIRYNKISQKYEIVEDMNSLWYSYSNKQWARILILDPDQLGSDITDEMIQNSYIWVPRFGKLDGEDEFYFQYKATDYAITNSYNNDNHFLYNYIDTNEKAWSSVVTFAEGKVGKWYTYSELTDPTSVAYQLNHSPYGPMLEY